MNKVPIELINKILLYRPVHPCAQLIHDAVEEFEISRVSFIEDFKSGTLLLSFNGSLHKMMVCFGMTKREASFYKWFFLQVVA